MRTLIKATCWISSVASIGLATYFMYQAAQYETVGYGLRPDIAFAATVITLVAGYVVAWMADEL